MRRTAATILLCGCLFAGAQHAGAQSYPDRSVKIVVPSAPGGSIDLSGRIVAEGLSAMWSKPVVIENRPGASMRIGAEAVARATPDGYTLLVAHDGTMAMNPVVYPDLKYSPTNDFEPIALLSAMPYALLAHKSGKAKSVKELIEIAKARPNELTHGTGGTSTLLAFELFKSHAKVEVANVYFSGAAPVINAIMGNHIDVAMVDIASAQPALTSPDVRALVMTSAARVGRYPDVPTMAEARVGDYVNETWMGLFAPTGTDKSILEKLRADVEVILKRPNVVERFDVAGMRAQGGGADAMRNALERDLRIWAGLVKQTNIKVAQ